MQFQVTLGIDAETQQHATDIAKAAIDIINALSPKDLQELARLLKTNPKIVQTAKRFLT